MSVDVDMMFSELNRGLKARANPDVEFDPLELARIIFPWEWIKYQRELLHMLLSDSWTRLVVLAPPRHRKPLWIGTLVTLPDGRSKLLADIQPGDEIVSGFGNIRRVKAVYDQGLLPTIEIITKRGSVYSAHDHPFLTTKGFKDAINLRPGDFLLSTPRRKPIPVIYVQPAGLRPCRCLDIETDHTFLANSFIVHNTSIVSLFAAISLGLDNTNRIMFASHTRDYSALLMNQVEEIMKTPAYRRIFGDILPKQLYASSNQTSRALTITNVRWTTYERHLPNRPPRIKDPTMLAISPDSGTPGFGASLILADDLVSQANSSSPTRRKHLEHWFKASLLKRLDPDGKILVVGARFYKHDLYGTLLDEGWEHIILTASPEKPLWPQKWPAALLEQKRQEDPVFFPAQYLQDPQDVEGAGLDPSWFSFYIEAPENMAIFAGVDPGITDSRGSKTAYVIVGRTVTGEVLLIDGASKFMRGGQLLQLINTIQERYKPVAIGFESNGPQQSIMELITNSQELQPGTNLVGVPSLTSKYLRMSSLAAYARSGRLKLPGSLTRRGEIEPDSIAKQFLSAWASFPSGDTDFLDAYDKAVQLALQGPPPAVAKPDPNRDRRIVKPFSGPAFTRVFRDRRRFDDEI